MKFYVITIMLCFLSQVLSQPTICLHNCRDFFSTNVCSIYSKQCTGNRMIRAMCPMTCKVCTTCKEKGQRIGIAFANGKVQSTNETSKCRLDCRDIAPTDQCFAIKNTISHGCAMFSQSCRLSCNHCRLCAIPKPKQKCTFDCEDHEESCKHWKSIGHCQKSSKYYPFMSKKCPLSCGVCKLCPTPKPENTVLPPTPQSCSTNCSDTHTSCSYWKKKGFCKKTKQFPHIMKVCAMTCEACKLCPTEASPVLPPCRQDCKDGHNDCEFWQKQGHCDINSKYPHTRKVCSKSCGICTACPNENLSSTSQPTRKKVEKFQN